MKALEKIGKTTLALTLGLGLLSAGGARADEVLKLRLTLRSDSLKKTVKITNSGLGEARKTLEQWYPRSARSMNTWKFFDLLQVRGVTRRLARAASLSGQKTYPIEVDLEDSSENGGKGVWPHASARSGKNVVYLGETGMNGRSKAKMFITLMHEFGHMGDTSEYDGLGYGDGSHTIYEIIAPAGSFAEGFAHYVSYRDLTREQVKKLGEKYLLTKYDRIMNPMKGDKIKVEYRDGSQVQLYPRDLTLWHFVCNESFVAGVIFDVEALKYGKFLVEESIRDTQKVRNRHLGTFLKQVLKIGKNIVPDLHQHLREILSIRTLQTATEADIERLIGGELGKGMKAHKALTRDYYPIEDGEEMVAPVNGLQGRAADQPAGFFGFSY